MTIEMDRMRQPRHLAGIEPPRVVTFRAMNTTMTMQLVGPGPDADAALAAAEDVFHRVEKACTRFNPDSPLMQANAAADDWCTVPVECYIALAEAARAHAETGGLFDPRVLDSLVALGYDRTLPFDTGSVQLGSGAGAAAVPRAQVQPVVGPWLPAFDEEAVAVRVGQRAIDLGGIGKGLAVRWAAQALSGAGLAYLIEAGGDCYLGGNGPEDDGWRVGVEDPDGGSEPVAVLQLSDIGCATSSLRVRAWRVDGRPVHHLIDPRTGGSSLGGLRSVTVLGPDTAWAEVWSKSLLIVGRSLIRELAEQRGLAAMWVQDDGTVGQTSAMEPWVMWQALDGR
jgi:thiamine biosynthesis lipoprotein